MLNYLLESNADIIGLQEVSSLNLLLGKKDWFDTLNGANGLTAAGYTCVKGLDTYTGSEHSSSLINEREKTMFNPIYFKTDKYTLIANDTIWFTDAEHRYEASRIDGANTDKALNYVVLEDKETGVRFMYVNLHLIVKGDYKDDAKTEKNNNWIKDANGNLTDHQVQELQVVYLREILEDLQEQYDLPMFIGGDFNNSASTITSWYNKSIVNDGIVSSNGNPTVAVKVTAASKNAENVVITDPSTSTIENDKFETRKDYTGGPIDLWFVANFEGAMHCYILDDNKNETTGKYPSDHLPTVFIVTLYSEKTN